MKSFKLLFYFSFLFFMGFSNAQESDISNESEIETPAADADKPSTPKEQPAQLELINPVSIERTYQTDLVHRLADDELKPMLAGEDEFVTLFRDNMTGQSKGVMIFVPDWTQSANSNRGIDHLRKEMNDYGWVTMSIAVPDPLYKGQVFADYDKKEGVDAARSNAKINTTDTFTTELATGYQASLQLRIQTILREAENYPGYFVIVGQGTSGAWLANMFATEKIEEPQALVLLSSALTNQALNLQLAKDIGGTEVPILDIYQSNDNQWLTASLKQRRQYARKFFKAHYRQRELFGDSSYRGQNQRLFKEVYGFLTSIGL